MSTIDVTIEQLRLSVSKAKTFKDCKRKFKFHYIEKLAPKDWRHLTFGSLIHKVLEEFHLYYINNPFDVNYNIIMAESFKKALAEFKGKYDKEMKLEAWELLNIYLKKIKLNFPKVLSCEEEFEYFFKNNIKLRGFIDRVQIDDDGIIHVCDYKTSKSAKYLIGDKFQLLTYAFIILQKDPTIERVRGSYIMIRDNSNMVGEEINKSFIFERKEILEVENLFENYAVDIRSESEFTPNPTALCNWCDYVDFCPEGKKKLFNRPTFGEVLW